MPWNVIVPGPMAVMSWIESEVSNAIDRGLTEITWVTPIRVLSHTTVDET